MRIKSHGFRTSNARPYYRTERRAVFDTLKCHPETGWHFVFWNSSVIRQNQPTMKTSWKSLVILLGSF